jgi:hypothetical protein
MGAAAAGRQSATHSNRTTQIFTGRLGNDTNFTWVGGFFGLRRPLLVVWRMGVVAFARGA